MSAASVAALLSAGGIGEPFFCHLRLEGPAAGDEQAAALLALAERPLGEVGSLVLRRRDGAGGASHWLVQARHARGVTQLHLHLGVAMTVIEAALDGREGTLSLERDGTVRRQGRAGAETIRLPGAPPAEAAACRRLLALLRATMTEPTAA
ncbi:hypothetical protein LPC08_16390 [Roseomonas sp. OT10]|uniref:hypothetical protein n=1 Tax=Roseomonas cutis TaxID=2897332 RepID=UPI001E46CE73|nr:hypothetical protein [Roseomonas sp. OT10]UFN47587.1 hypothetical protein LPC08_16390 [Roseomonas sp. OT10]